MNNQINHIIKGVLLLVALVITIGVINKVANIRPSAGSELSVKDTEKIPSAPVAINQKGQQLFKDNCAACHHVTKRLTGPALAGIVDRVPDKTMLYSWVRNSQAVINSGDNYFNNLFEVYNKVAMPSFPQLADEDLDAIFEYIEQASGQNKITAPAGGVSV